MKCRGVKVAAQPVPLEFGGAITLKRLFSIKVRRGNKEMKNNILMPSCYLTVWSQALAGINVVASSDDRALGR